MSGEIVVITADDLEPAVRLRGGFVAAGLTVELLTASEGLSDVPGDPVLLILTGGVHERRARQLVSAAREQTRLPIVALLEPTEEVSREACRALGASECFVKPIDAEEVVLVGRRLIERERLRGVTGIVGETEVMEEVLERVVRIAEVNSTVLIEGESGTGKELVARGLHALSPRRHKPFIAVNVAALPETLLESELFGHEKGAFTGAASLRKGLFELAQGGTIILDEIGEMPLATQTKLLRVLEEREFRRVGGESVLRVDVRVIAATNRDLREGVEVGEFRRDLYHRLNVLRIALPPLRNRRKDIPRLIEQFVREFSRQHDRPFPGIDPEALQLLVDYSWPGNVRELRNLIESMVVLAHRDPIRPGDIPNEVRAGGHRASLLPVPAPRPLASPQASGTPAELEFILRTIFDLKLDVEDLRREMENFRLRQDRRGELPYTPSFAVIPSTPTVEAEIPAEEEPAEPEGVVVYRPGMTMLDLEREAIGAALREVGGNRRRAAEILGIGERTLYRKIKEFDLD
ncbi:MAG: AAA domain-containing protein [Gemmatimonas sp.]|nr:AAA domain-containing protein [Gemmatimonas sp.]